MAYAGKASPPHYVLAIARRHVISSTCVAGRKGYGLIDAHTCCMPVLEGLELRQPMWHHKAWVNPEHLLPGSYAEIHG